MPTSPTLFTSRCLMPSLSIFTLFLLLGAASPGAGAAVYHVPGDYPFIQSAIDAAVDDDEIIIADGIYSGDMNRDLHLDGKRLFIHSENGAATCIIDCQGSDADRHRGLMFDSGDAVRTTLIQGLTITGGFQSNGGAVYVFDSSPTFADCIFDGNEASLGGAVYCGNSSAQPLFTRCAFVSNVASAYGGAVYVWGSESGCDNDPVFTDSVISGNGADRGGAVYVGETAHPEFHNCLVVDNQAGTGGGAYYLSGAYPVVKNCTVADNTALGAYGGGGFLTTGLSTGGGAIVDSIIWGNVPDQFDETPFTEPSVAYCDVQGGHFGGGNIDADPLFISGPDGDWYLSQTAAGQATDSPCWNAGSDPAYLVCFEGLDGDVCMNGLDTRTDGLSDAGVVDMGYHYDTAGGTAATIGCALTCQPASGTLPFSTLISVSLVNVSGFNSAVSAAVDVTLASGVGVTNWRSGHTVLTAGEAYQKAWNQPIPSMGSLAGDNIFRLRAEDATPPPYNQPPYPPSGDTDTGTCIVTGIAP